MSRPPKMPIEYRNYELPVQFPIILLTGERWHISDVQSGRLHFHNCLEIGLCHSESGFLEFDSMSYPFKKGDVTIISGDIPHTTYSSPGTASRWSYLFVDTEELLRAFFPVDALPHASILMDLEHNFGKILSGDKFPVIYQLVNSIMREMTEQKMNYQIAVRGLFLFLLTELMRYYSENKQAPEKQESDNILAISPALDYIRTNYMQNFTVDFLADLCHLSPTHFRRVFQSIMDMTPKEWRKKMSPLKQKSVLAYTGWK